MISRIDGGDLYCSDIHHNLENYFLDLLAPNPVQGGHAFEISPSTADLGDTPFLEVASSGMEPVFYVHIERLTYNGPSQHLSRKAPQDFRVVDGASRLDLWFAANVNEHYLPWIEPPPADLDPLSKDICAITLLEERFNERKLAALRADPREDQTDVVWGCIGFSPEPQENLYNATVWGCFNFASKSDWKIQQTLPSLHSSEQEPIICKDIPCPPHAHRWAYLFEDSRLFQNGPVRGTNHVGSQVSRLIGNRAMLWALGALYYLPDGNLSYSLPRMFDNGIWEAEYNKPDFYARNQNRSLESSNDVFVATVYWRAIAVSSSETTLI